MVYLLCFFLPLLSVDPWSESMTYVVLTRALAFNLRTLPSRPSCVCCGLIEHVLYYSSHNETISKLSLATS